MSQFKFGARSTRELLTVHPDIQKVMFKALDLGVMDFSVIQGRRTQAEQDRLYAQGRTEPGPIVTWTRDSLHLPQENGLASAIDIVPYPIDWQDEARFHQLSGIIKSAANLVGVELDWGYDLWGKDMPHWQLRG